MIEIKRGAKKFCSVTLDEYTSTRNKRYMNINLHYDSDPVNLGMVRIEGTLPAERVENLVKDCTSLASRWKILLQLRQMGQV